MKLSYLYQSLIHVLEISLKLFLEMREMQGVGYDKTPPSRLHHRHPGRPAPAGKLEMILGSPVASRDVINPAAGGR